MSQISYSDLKCTCIAALRLQSPKLEITQSRTSHRLLSNLAMEAIQRHQPSLQLMELIPSNEPLFTVPRSRGHDHDHVVRENDVGNVRAPLGKNTVYEILYSFVNKEPETGDIPLGERPLDTGTEGDMSEFVVNSDNGTRVVDQIVNFLYYLNQYKENRPLFEKIRRIKIFDSPHPSCANTTPDKIIGIPITVLRRTAEVVCVLEFKKPSLSGDITRIIDQAVEEGWPLERDWAEEAELLAARRTSMTTALASVGQVFEQLVGNYPNHLLPNGTPCLFTSVYGFQYLATWDSINRKLLWSKNTAGPQLRQAANIDAARLDEATGDNIFDFFFNGILQGMNNAITSWEC